jgi:hypothetical protein
VPENKRFFGFGQTGEIRAELNGIQEVVGSIPIGSTISPFLSQLY